MKNCILVLIPPCGVKGWLDENADKISAVQLGTQRGTFRNGEKFFYRVTEGNWINRLLGHHFTELLVMDDVRLTSFEKQRVRSMLSVEH